LGADKALLVFKPILGALAVPVVEGFCAVPADAYIQLMGTTTAILGWCPAPEDATSTGALTLTMRCTEWRDWSVNSLLTTQTRLHLQALHLLHQWKVAADRVTKTTKNAQDTTTAAVTSVSEAAATFAARLTATRALLHHEARHLRDQALQQWEAAVAQVAKTGKGAQNTTTATVTSVSDAATVFAAHVTTTISSSAAFALSQLQPWGPSILGVFLLALAVSVAWKVHVAMDGAIVPWTNKTVRYLAPRVVAWLHWLLIWAMYLLDCVVEGVLDFIVAPSLMVLAGSIVPIATFFVCAFISLAFPRWVKPNHDIEKKKEGISLLGEATATMAVATATEKVSMGIRIVRLSTSKSTTAAPRRPRLAWRSAFTGKASMLPRPRISSAAIHERPTPTASDATLEIGRVRSESRFVVWARRAARGASMSMGLRRVSQEAAKAGEAAMVADGC
jgi:hypothetical protein